MLCKSIIIYIKVVLIFLTFFFKSLAAQNLSLSKRLLFVAFSEGSVRLNVTIGFVLYNKNKPKYNLYLIVNRVIFINFSHFITLHKKYRINYCTSFSCHNRYTINEKNIQYSYYYQNKSNIMYDLLHKHYYWYEPKYLIYYSPYYILGYKSRKFKIDRNIIKYLL